jgi:hypothetical protein
MRGELEPYEGFCEKYSWWNFHLVLKKPENLAVVRAHNPELGERVEQIFAQKDGKSGDCFPQYFPQLYEAYKILHQNDTSDSFIPRTWLDESGKF